MYGELFGIVVGTVFINERKIQILSLFYYVGIGLKAWRVQYVDVPIPQVPVPYTYQTTGTVTGSSYY